MTLDLDQLRALADLKRKAAALREAHQAYGAAENRCWELAISGRQIAVIADLDSYATIYRRYAKRLASGHSTAAQPSRTTDGLS